MALALGNLYTIEAIVEVPGSSSSSSSSSNSSSRRSGSRRRRRRSRSRRSKQDMPRPTRGRSRWGEGKRDNAVKAGQYPDWYEKMFVADLSLH
jgi:hypothetical protein